MRTILFLAVVFYVWGAAANPLVYQCRGKKILAAVKVDFQTDDYGVEKKKTAYDAVSKLWIEKNPQNEYIIRKSGTSDFYQQEHEAFATSWWDYDYTRMVLVLGGSKDLKNDIDPNGLDNFYTLTLSSDFKTARLVWGHSDRRGGPTHVCIMGRCRGWRDTTHNAKCRLQK